MARILKIEYLTYTNTFEYMYSYSYTHILIAAIMNYRIHNTLNIVVS